MGVVGKLFTAQMVGDSAKEGIKSVKKTYNDSMNNKYSTLLGTNINTSAPKEMGIRNAMNTRGTISVKKPEITASEQIDEIYKSASASSINRIDNIKRRAKNMALGISSGIEGVSRKINEIDDRNTEHIRNATRSLKSVKDTKLNILKNKDSYNKLNDIGKRNIKNFQKQQISNALKEGGKAALVTVPAVGGMIMAGKGVTKGLEKLDKRPKQNERTDMEKKIIGGSITGALMLNAIAHKKVLKPFSVGMQSATKSAKNIVENNATRAIGQEMFSKNPEAHMVAGIVKKPITKINKNLTKKHNAIENMKRATNKKVVRINGRPVRQNINNRNIINRNIINTTSQVVNNEPKSPEFYQEKLNQALERMERNNAINNSTTPNGRKKFVGNVSEHIETEVNRNGNRARIRRNINNKNYRNGKKYNNNNKYRGRKQTNLNNRTKKYNRKRFKPRFDENGPNKNASEIIDSLYKTAEVVVDPYAVQLGKEFLKGGLETIPSMVAPATLAFIVSRDISKIKKLKKKNSEQKQPSQPKQIKPKKNKEFKKVAFTLPEPINRYKNEAVDYIKQYPKKAGLIAAKSLGSTLIPGAAIYVTGRNIGGYLEKVNREDVSIRKRVREAEALKKQMEEEKLKQQNQEKKADNEELEGYDIGDVYQDINDEVYGDVLNAKKIEKKPVHIGNGVKKTFRLNDGFSKDDSDNGDDK